MRNEEIAKLLNQISSLLQLKGEIPYKFIAYAEAARRVANLPIPIEDLHREGKLREIPNVGPSIASKIAEYLDTGHCVYLEGLLGEIPVELIELERIPGVGPKLAQLFYRELRVHSIEELEQAARQGKLRKLFRLGAKAESNILQAIETLKRRSDQVPLGVALPLAESILKTLRNYSFVLAAQGCGSLRRMKETVGDLDILVASREAEEVMKAFTQLSEVRKVLLIGPTKASIISESDIQVDLRVVEPSSFGAALQYFTGSQAHNVRVREIAVRLGFKLNEYGLYRLEDDKKIAGETEEGIYAALGLAWVPPELREDQGEIEAAKEGRLPSLVEIGDIKGDLHVHTDWSDGTSSIREMVQKARALGHQYLAICDHGVALAVAGGLCWEDFLKQKMEIAQVEREEGFPIFWGIEANILTEGQLDFTREKLLEFDLVVAGIHSGFNQDSDKMTERLLSALRNGLIDIISHPSGRLIGKRNPYQIDVKQMLKGAQQMRTAMEINSSPERLDLKDLDARLAWEQFGLKLAICTDAHSPLNMDWLKFGIGVARRAWLEKGNLLNAFPYSQLKKWLKQRRKTTLA